MEIKEMQEAVSAGLKQLQDDFAKLGTEMKAAVSQEIEEKTKQGFADPETREKLVKMEAAMGDIEKKMSSEFRRIEGELLRPGAPGSRQHEEKSVGSQFTEDEGFLKWREEGFPARGGMRRYIRSYKGFFSLEKKTLTTGLGYGTTGIIPFTREAGIDQLPRQGLRIRSVMDVRQMTGGAVDYLQQQTFTNAASPQTEGSAKAVSSLSYVSASATPKTIAHTIDVSRQSLDDVPGIRADIDDIMMYGVLLKEESEILWGDGLGNHLHGIGTQATAYDTGLNASGDTKLDKLRHALLQVRLALYPVDAIILHPEDLHDIELIKDDVGGANTGKYIVGDPRTGVEMTTLWGKPVIESDSAVSGVFLVGAFRRGATLYDRMQANVDISFENDTNFEENLATIRAEERIALAVKRTGSFVKGSF